MEGTIYSTTRSVKMSKTSDTRPVTTCVEIYSGTEAEYSSDEHAPSEYLYFLLLDSMFFYSLSLHSFDKVSH